MNKKNPRIHREVLQEELARSLLNVPYSGEGRGSLWQHLEQVRRELEATVQHANKELQANPLAEILAEHAMRQIGKRGTPHVEVDPDGSVMLVIDYESPPKADKVPVEPATRKSSLPSITALRAEAEALGINHAPFGKNKTRLLKAIETAQASAPTNSKKAPAAPPAPVAPAPATPVPAPAPVAATSVPAPAPAAPPSPPPKATKVTPVTTLLQDDDDDVNSLFGNTEPTPAPAPVVPRRGTPSAVPARKVGGRPLSELVTKADAEVDIDAILAKGNSAPQKS